jgi:hypothetical protein
VLDVFVESFDSFRTDAAGDEPNRFNESTPGLSSWSGFSSNPVVVPPKCSLQPLLNCGDPTSSRADDHKKEIFHKLDTSHFSATLEKLLVLVSYLAKKML